MLTFVLKKMMYGILVLMGVVTVVFFLFNMAPGDPVRNLVGENASEEVVQNMRRKLDLDLPIGQRFILYINDLSPVSINNPEVKESRIYFDESKYQGFQVIKFSDNRALVMKLPYLKRSFISDKSVSSILGEVMPGTVVLAVVSIALAMFFGLIMGIIAALEKDSFFDRLILFASALGMAGPSFFVAIIVAWVGAILWRDEINVPYILVVTVLLTLLVVFIPSKKFRGKFLTKRKATFILLSSGFLIWIVFGLSMNFPFATSKLKLPGTGLNMTGSLYGVDVWKGEFLNLRNMILPVITLMIRPLSVIVQLTRSSLLDVMQQDYIRTARAKGLSEYRVIVKHALRNALNPVITAISGWFASLLAGAIFVEFVFGWKGLGQQMFTAIENQDLPVVMGGVIVISVAFVFINILVDFIYGWIDPRVRIG